MTCVKGKNAERTESIESLQCCRLHQMSNVYVQTEVSLNGPDLKK